MYSLYKNEHKVFKPVEITIRSSLGRKKKNSRDEPIWVIIHLHMEMSQGNSLYSYLKQRKMPFIFLLQNWRTGE
jgi:hypothetical protein